MGFRIYAVAVIADHPPNAATDPLAHGSLLTRNGALLKARREWSAATFDRRKNCRPASAARPGSRAYPFGSLRRRLRAKDPRPSPPAVPRRDGGFFSP